MPKRGIAEVEVKVVPDPEGEPGVLLQLPHGYLVMKNPDEIHQLGTNLHEAANELATAMSGLTYDPNDARLEAGIKDAISMLPDWMQDCIVQHLSNVSCWWEERPTGLWCQPHNAMVLPPMDVAEKLGVTKQQMAKSALTLIESWNNVTKEKVE